MLCRACQRCIDDGLFVDRDPGLMVSMRQVELSHWLEGAMQGEPEQVAQEVEQQIERAFRRPGEWRLA